MYNQTLPRIHPTYIHMLYVWFPYAKQIPDAAGGGGCIHFLHFTYTHTHRFMSSMYISLSYPSSLPPHLFSSLPDPASGPPRRSCFLLPDWACIAHMHSHTLSDSLSVDTWFASQSSSSSLQTSLHLWCGGQGQKINVCVCVCTETQGQGARRVWGLFYSGLLNTVCHWYLPASILEQSPSRVCVHPQQKVKQL